MKDNRVLLLLAFALFALLFSVLTALFWSFMTDRILVPIYYVLWVGGLMINSVSQAVYLALLVLLSIGIAMRTLASPRSNWYQQRTARDESGSITRYQHWRLLCTYAYGTWFSRNRLASELRGLLLSILAFEQGIEPAEVEEMVRNGALDVPAALRDVIVSKNIPGSPPNRLPHILSWLLRPIRWRKPDSDPYVDQFLTEFISFVEHHLEITHYARDEFES